MKTLETHERMLLDTFARILGSSKEIVSSEDRVNASKLLECVITCVGHKDVWPWRGRDHTLLVKHFHEVTAALHSVAGLTDADLDFERARQAIHAVLAKVEVRVVGVKRLKRTLVPTSLAGATRPRDEGILDDRHCPALNRLPRCSPGPLDILGTPFACQSSSHGPAMPFDAYMLGIKQAAPLNHIL